MAAPRIKRKGKDVRRAWERANGVTQFCAVLDMALNQRAARRLCEENGLDYPAPHWGGREACIVIPDAPNELTDDDLLRLCEDRGIAVLRDAMREDREVDVTVPAIDGQGTFRFGIVSDTHACSKYQQVTFLHSAYDYFEREGITDVLHAGDWTAGAVHMHPGMVYEMFAHGGDQQAEYVCESFPLRDGVTTHGISGNHDHSHMKSGGVNVVKRIASERDDIEYLGMSGAYLTINGIRVYLHHPSGGVAYARSYRMQKIVEQFSPQNKPKILICGHWHTTCLLPMYRNVYSLAVPCLEAQTPYLVEKGLYPEIGYATLEVTYDDEGAVKFRGEFVPFYTPIPHDYGLKVTV